MKVILRSDQKGLGKRGDIVEVVRRPRPQLPAAQGPSPSRPPTVRCRQAQAMRRARDLRDAQDRESAQTIASALVATTITITAKAGAEGRLFGSVTAADMAEAVAGAGQHHARPQEAARRAHQDHGHATRCRPSCTATWSSRSPSRSSPSKSERRHNLTSLSTAPVHLPLGRMTGAVLSPQAIWLSTPPSTGRRP